MAFLKSGARVAQRYLLEQCIGRGGHAQIWTATDEYDATRVALKFLHPETCDPDHAWEVLQHEAAMAARVEHPGVLRTGPPQRDGDVVFLPLEYAGGTDVTALRGASYLRIVPLLIEVAGILGHAHQRGIVHRDVKPGNVLVDATGVARLVDFGTAAMVGSVGGIAPGSPFTSSPQQLCGEPAAVADDVYGLGAMAYELLGGYPPDYPNFNLSRALVQMPATLRPQQAAPPRLVDLVMRMLARDPAKRPADLGQVVDQFWRVLADTRLIDERVASSAMVSESRLSLRRPVWLLAGLFVLLFIVGGLVWMRSAPSASRVLALQSEGLLAERAGDRQRAVARFDEALMLDPGFEPARAARARVTAEQRRIVAAAMAEVAQREQRAANERDERVGRQLEAAERWVEAVTLYQVALDRDSTAPFARVGLLRSRERAALDAQLQDYIDRSAQLESPEVRREALQVRNRARAVQPAPRLSRQLQRLDELLAGFKGPR
jgi:tetratricopeptide (TPR) repeat protein